MRSVTMISSELDPFYVTGGIAYAIRRLADQLTELGIETRVLLPDWVDTRAGQNSTTPLLTPVSLKMRNELRGAPRAQRYSDFCSAALEAVEQIRSDAVIAHGYQGAMFIVLRNGKRSQEPSVFWLHDLYDPPISDFSKEQRALLPSPSLLASAVMTADIVVASMGILKDAREVEWPDGLKELQKALTMASSEHRVLTVESVGCLPEVRKNSETSSNLENLKNVPSPYVFFPCRPTLTKGFGIFAAIAERLRADNIACVALRPPAQATKLESPSQNTLIHWLPWLTQEELLVAMRHALCTVLPSFTEGYGLTAAESISLGVPTLYHKVGGHHGLQALPNALPISLTTSELMHLYSLWSELIVLHPYSWPDWTRYEVSVRPLIDKWVEAIRSVKYCGNGVIAPAENVQPVETERWGNKLRRRIENGHGGNHEVATELIEPHVERWPLDGRPRLVHVMPWDLTVGGAQRMLDLWCSHEAHRWDTHILSIGARGPFAFPGATIHSELERSQILSLIETLKPDLLVHHEPSDRNGIDSGCPQVWILHCTKSLRELPPTHAKPAIVFSNLDSDEIHSAWRQLPLKVLRPQINTSEFRPFKQKHDGLVCGIVGRLHQDKVPMSFIEALSTWQPGPWRIRFIGQGLDTGYQRYVSEKLMSLPWVEFSGDVPPGEMPPALGQLDAVLVPTDAAHGETGSYAALEAMAMGLPVIARDLAGLRYNCGDVPLYANTDTELLARLRDLDHADVRSAAGSEARQWVVGHAVQAHAATHSAGFSASLGCEVSILMPVFDTPATYLSECWDSIREQTFREWELALVDDGSRARETVAEIDRIARDPRVVLIRLEKNQGIAHALNVGLSRCRANLVARMDADDKMLPTRLQRQIEYLRLHPEVTVLGTQMQAIDWETNRLLSPTKHPEQVTDEYIEHQRNTTEIFFLNHPTVMLRRREVMNLGGYPLYRVAQDLGLWLKVFRAGLKIHNLPSVELHYRLHPNQVSTFKGVRREEYAQIIEQCYSGQ